MYVSDYMELLKKELQKHGVDANISSNINGQFEKFIAGTDFSSVTIEFEEPKAIKDYKNLSVVDKCNDVIIYLNSILKTVEDGDDLNVDMVRELETSLSIVKNELELLDKELAKFKNTTIPNYRPGVCCANCKFNVNNDLTKSVCKRTGLPISLSFVCDDFMPNE